MNRHGFNSRRLSEISYKKDAHSAVKAVYVFFYCMCILRLYPRIRTACLHPHVPSSFYYGAAADNIFAVIHHCRLTGGECALRFVKANANITV